MCVVQAFLHALLDMLSYFLNESLCRLMDIGKFEKLKFSESQCGMCVLGVFCTCLGASCSVAHVLCVT